MGLLTAPLILVRAPVRVALKATEVGLSTAAEVARIGTELLNPDREAHDFSEYEAQPGYPAGNGTAPPAAPDVEHGSPAEPEVVTPETAYIAPEPGELGPEPDVLDVAAAAAATDAPPSIPDELIPDHVDEEPVLVVESAEAGAEDGAGPELTIEAPWDGYDEMTAADISDRLAAATAVEAAAVELYEASRKNRRTVIDAAARVLSR
ncbi:MAG TPA: hypothetical protein VJT68_02610 [Thermoleophilaceae bacterium]|nr:hypothetical protein [Thermoleophilaceae bacterium]